MSGLDGDELARSIAREGVNGRGRRAMTPPGQVFDAWAQGLWARVKRWSEILAVVAAAGVGGWWLLSPRVEEYADKRAQALVDTHAKGVHPAGQAHFEKLTESNRSLAELVGILACKDIAQIVGTRCVFKVPGQPAGTSVPLDDPKALVQAVAERLGARP